MTQRKGTFVISLDFELHWGVRDKVTLDAYGANLRGSRVVVPQLLELFRGRGVHATWAAVGLLCCDGRHDVERWAPTLRPRYLRTELSPYDALPETGSSESSDPLHYAPSLIAQILATPFQELGTHTFSHYYCLEDGQTAETFRADLIAAQTVAKEKFGVELRSIVFPRNQFRASYLEVCQALGFEAYRGNPRAWLYRERADDQESAVRRGFRLLDAYLPLSGRNISHSDPSGAVLVDVPASRFLRPVSARLGALEELRLARIVRDMRHAAEQGALYHLWWHPHNFGRAPDENLQFLTALLDEFESLRRSHGMESATMLEAARASRAIAA